MIFELIISLASLLFSYSVNNLLELKSYHGRIFANVKNTLNLLLAEA